MKLLDRLELRTFWTPNTCHWSGGDSSAQGAEKSSANFANTLQSAFSQQFAQQSATLNFLNSKMTSQINNPQGYGSQAVGSMRTSAADTVAKQYQDATRASQNREFNQGGQNLPSGVDAQINAGIATDAARTNSDVQNSITQADAQLKQSNFWNATNTLNGVAQEYNPNAMAGSANSASGEVANLSQAVTAANGPTIGSIVGGIGSAAAGAVLSGGMSNLGKGLSFFGKSK